MLTKRRELAARAGRDAAARGGRDSPSCGKHYCIPQVERVRGRAAGGERRRGTGRAQRNGDLTGPTGLWRINPPSRIRALATACHDLVRSGWAGRLRSRSPSSGSMGPGRPPCTLSSSRRGSVAPCVNNRRNTAGEDSNRCRSGRNNTPSAPPASAASFKRRSQRSSVPFNHSKTAAQTPELKACSAAHKASVARRRPHDDEDGRARFPVAPGPAQKAHAAGQSRRARAHRRPACAETAPERAKKAGSRRVPMHRSAPRRATPSASHRPASAHRARVAGGPCRTRRRVDWPRRLLTSRRGHRPIYPQAMMPHAASTSLPRRSTPTTTPSIIMGCCFRSTRMGSKSAFSGISQTIEPSCR